MSNRYEEYKAGETEERRVEGTAIGKAAVREFVRGLEIRESSPYEHPDYMAPKNKVAAAAFHFFKWLAEVPGWEFVSNMLMPDGDDRYMILELSLGHAGCAHEGAQATEKTIPQGVSQKI